MVDCVRFEETELRLGLPNANYGKRGYEETVDLKLNLSSTEIGLDQSDLKETTNLNKEKNLLPNCVADSVKPPAK